MPYDPESIICFGIALLSENVHVIYGLDVKCPFKTYMFEPLVLSWQYCSERLLESPRWGLPRGSGLLKGLGLMGCICAPCFLF